jgi:hypothetical protein
MNFSAVIAAYEPVTKTRGARRWVAATKVMRNHSFWLTIGVMMILTLIIGWLDYITGFQVTMANAAKHSSATSIHVAMKLEDEMLELRVEDNSQGMPPGAVHDALPCVGAAGRAGDRAAPSPPGGTLVSCRVQMKDLNQLKHLNDHEEN